MQSYLLLGTRDYFTGNINSVKTFWALSNNLGCTLGHVQYPFVEDEHQDSMENGLSGLEKMIPVMIARGPSFREACFCSQLSPQ